MTITVRLFATFRDFLPQHALQSGLQMDVRDRDTVQALMQALAVPEDLPRIVLINGRHAMETSVLTDGDSVSVFPPLIGGCSAEER